MNMPLVHRVVTLTGDGVNEPSNMDVPLGISHKYLADECGGIKDSTVKIISGGPMMGMAMNSLDYPVIKTSSSILAITHDNVEKMETSACIRCGRCVGACPETLVPQLMAQAVINKNYEQFEKLYGMECIECGCCTYVCPAKRPLTQTFKLAKIKVRESKATK
jgi:electron transport complex protein RnfC